MYIGGSYMYVRLADLPFSQDWQIIIWRTDLDPPPHSLSPHVAKSSGGSVITAHNLGCSQSKNSKNLLPSILCTCTFRFGDYVNHCADSLSAPVNLKKIHT